MNFIDGYLSQYFVLIGWAIAVLITLVLAVPYWILLYQIRYYYRKNNYDKCLTTTLKAMNYDIFVGSTIVKISYVLSCSLMLHRTEVFEKYLSKIRSRKPRANIIRLSWTILFLLDQERIDAAVELFHQLTQLTNQYATDFIKKVRPIFDHYEKKITFNQNDLIVLRNQSTHPVVKRIYQSIIDDIS